MKQGRPANKATLLVQYEPVTLCYTVLHCVTLCYMYLLHCNIGYFRSLTRWLHYTVLCYLSAWRESSVLPIYLC